MRPAHSALVEVREPGAAAFGALLACWLAPGRDQVADSTQGFSLTLAGAKAWLEHGIQLNLVADRHPKGIDHGNA